MWLLGLIYYVIYSGVFGPSVDCSDLSPQAVLMVVKGLLYGRAVLWHAQPAKDQARGHHRTPLHIRAAAATEQAPAEQAARAASAGGCPMSVPVGASAVPLPDGRPLEYVPMKQMKQGPYRMTMGLEPMHPRDWIEIDGFYAEEMEMRRDILQNHRDVVLAVMPQAEEACQELLEMLADHLPGEYPTLFHREGSTLLATLTGERFLLEPGASSMHPLEACARLVQEDLCLMQDDPSTPNSMKFTAGAVLFPQRWSLLEKLGMDLHRIHDPVPQYEQEVSRPVDSFMRLMKPGKPFWRANWTITDHPDLFQPLVEDDIRAMTSGRPREAFTQVTAENAGQTLCTRCERETFTRLPRTQAILFTIRTFLRPLHKYAAKTDEAVQLGNALRNLPEDLVNYKTMGHIKEHAQNYLDAAVLNAEAIKDGKTIARAA